MNSLIMPILWRELRFYSPRAWPELDSRKPQRSWVPLLSLSCPSASSQVFISSWPCSQAGHLIAIFSTQSWFPFTKDGSIQTSHRETSENQAGRKLCIIPHLERLAADTVHVESLGPSCEGQLFRKRGRAIIKYRECPSWQENPPIHPTSPARMLLHTILGTNVPKQRQMQAGSRAS